MSENRTHSERAKWQELVKEWKVNSPLASVAESRIQEALEAGADMDLVGAGKPLDLDGYFAAPSALRAGFGMLKSAGVVPPEVEAMRDVGLMREKLETMEEGPQKEMLIAELRLREVELAMAMERMKRHLKSDATS